MARAMTGSDHEERARAVLAGDGRVSGAPLRLIRLKPDQTVSFQAGDRFIKLYLGDRAAPRAAAAHAAQARAAALASAGAPLSPRPGPLIDDGFVMPWLNDRRMGAALASPFRARGRAAMMARTGGVLARLHDSEDCAPVHFGGWPAKLLRARAANPSAGLWPEFARQAYATADLLWEHRQTPSPGGWVHGDLHVDNIMIAADGPISLIDFNVFEVRPIITDIALFLVSAASRTPLWLVGKRGRFGVSQTDEDAFLAHFPSLVGHERLLALHMLRLALSRADMALEHKARGPNAIRVRRMRRLRRLAHRLHRIVFA